MKKRIKISEKSQYLVIPIKAKQEKSKIFLYLNDTILSELNIPIGIEEENMYSYDFLAYLPMDGYVGREIILEGDVSEAFMKAIHTTDTNTRKRSERPAIHFTPDYGWINDPNGLVYQDGLYHLYFQYNPFDTEWDNMSWGHAVSEDLLHWNQKDITLLPDEEGMIFSGCGLVNDFELLGLPKDALLFFYSAAGDSNELSKGKEFVQKLAYSLDNGTTLIKKQSILSTVCKENRDPKIFWHEATKAYIMCLWLEKEEFAIFRSSDLELWEMSQRFVLDGGFECPDLFELTIKTSKDSCMYGKSKWVFWCADGFYYLGDFDGYEFHLDGTRKEAYATKLPYAAQTISNLGDKVISIPWLRTKTIDRLYTGCMGIPREFSLVAYKQELWLKQSLVESIVSIQNLVLSKSKEMKQSSELRLLWDREGAVKIDMVLSPSLEKQPNNFECNILGTNISYNSQKNALRVEENEIQIEGNIADFCVIFDKGIIEITANNDIIYAVFEVAYKSVNNEVVIISDNLEEIRIFEIL